jgi:bacillithiol disulfide reductase
MEGGQSVPAGAATRRRRGLDVGIVGAGPVGLAAAIVARRLGLRARVWDRGPLCASVLRYPTNMVFFTSNELLEIGDHPLVTGGPKATRREALDYYRKVADREELDVVTGAGVENIVPIRDGFRIRARAAGVLEKTTCRTVVVATGYYSNPHRLGVPGEDLPHVSHYYVEAHPFWRRKVVIVGGGNSAVEAALDLYRAGASVTMLVRGGALRKTVKYWMAPDIANRLREGAIAAVFRARVDEITGTHVRCTIAGEPQSFPADHVLLLTGFSADPGLVREAGAEVRADGSVVLDPATYETTLPGLYVVGSAGYGSRTAEVFIENGRLHARAAVEAIARRLGRGPA